MSGASPSFQHRHKRPILWLLRRDLDDYCHCCADVRACSQGECPFARHLFVYSYQQYPVVTRAQRVILATIPGGHTCSRGDPCIASCRCSFPSTAIVVVWRQSSRAFHPEVARLVEGRGTLRNHRLVALRGELPRQRLETVRVGRPAGALRWSVLSRSCPLHS